MNLHYLVFIKYANKIFIFSREVNKTHRKYMYYQTQAKRYKEFEQDISA